MTCLRKKTIEKRAICKDRPLPNLNPAQVAKLIGIYHEPGGSIYALPWNNSKEYLCLV